MVAIALVLLSASIGALALVLLRKAAQDSPDVSLVRSLLRPLWIAGVAAMGVEFCTQVLALANGPIATVQLLVVMELPFCLILSRIILGGRLGSREWSAIGAMTAGVIVLLASLSPHGGDPAAISGAVWALGLGATIAAIGVVLAGRRWLGPAARTALAGIAAGMTAGLVAVLIKPVTTAASGGVGAVLGSWQAWAALVGCGAAFGLLRSALRSGRLVASQPGITLANPLLAALWGVTVFGERVHTGWWLLGAAAGAVLFVGGAVLLSRSPLLADEHESSLRAAVEPVVQPRVPEWVPAG
ncbi:MAG TPA: DMT family transporter [Pseudonocardiaceae bacterium]|nr:DMT family transporter [Pseudonocardiaceae bacterium]